LSNCISDKKPKTSADKDVKSGLSEPHFDQSDEPNDSESTVIFPGVAKILWRMGLVKPFLWYSIVWVVLCGAARVSTVFLFREVVLYFEKGELNLEVGISLVIAVWFAQVVDQLATLHAWVKGIDLAVGVQQLMMAEVYGKALKISLSAREGNTTGEIINLMSNDCRRLFEAGRLLLHPVWGICQIIIFSALLIWQLGAVGLVGVLGIAMMPIWSSLIKKMVVKYKKKLLKWTDQRVKLTTEILQGILLVKMYAWETPFVKRLEKLRLKELSELKFVLISKMMAINLPIQWP